MKRILSFIAVLFVGACPASGAEAQAACNATSIAGPIAQGLTWSASQWAAYFTCLQTQKQDALGYTPLNPANNLSDVNAAAARGNLGLGALATINTSGSSLLAGDGAAGIANVTLGANLSLSGGTLSATSGGVPSIAGTSHQVTESGSPNVTTLSIPSDFRLPGTINLLTLTQPATGSTLTLADGKTFTVSNTLTVAGTDNSTLNIGSGGTLGSNAFTSTVFCPLAGCTYTGTIQASGWSMTAAGALSDLSEAIGGGSAITSSGPGGALGSNAFNSTAYLPLGGGTMTGTLTFSDTGTWGSGGITDTNPASLGNVNVTSSTVPANGMYMAAANSVQLATNSTSRLSISTSQINVTLSITGSSNGAELFASNATATVPTLIPNRASTGTGIGGASGNLNFIDASASVMDYNATTASTWTIPTALTASNATIKLTGLAAGTAADLLCYASSTGLVTYETTGTTCAVSRRDAKRDISQQSTKRDLSVILGLQPVSFRYKAGIDDGGAEVHYGFVAEDVLKVAPELVAYEPNSTKIHGVKYGEMQAYFVGAMQAMQNEIDAGPDHENDLVIVLFSLVVMLALWNIALTMHVMRK